MVLNNSYKPNIMLTNGVIKGDFKSFMTSYFAKNAIRFRNNTILLQMPPPDIPHAGRGAGRQVKLL